MYTTCTPVTNIKYFTKSSKSWLHCILASYPGPNFFVRTYDSNGAI